MVAKREWGAKHLCTGCGARYYDLNRNPITCPSCGEVHVPEVAPKSRRSATAKQKAKPKIATVSKAAVPLTATLKIVPDSTGVAPIGTTDDDAADAVVGVEVEVEVDDDDENGADVIEDASELGEDEDDMAEVIEGSREAKED